MPTVRSSAGVVCGVVALTTLACTPALKPATLTPAPVPPMDSIELALFLIGDAGSKAYDGEPVLAELARQADSFRTVKQYVVFLGDNVYPRGVPPVGHPARDRIGDVRVQTRLTRAQLQHVPNRDASASETLNTCRV